MMNTIEEKQLNNNSSSLYREKDIEKQLLEKIQSWDLIDSYKFFRNYISENPIVEYVVKKKCVEFGKELLPTDLKEGNSRKRIEGIYNHACKILNEARPSRRTIKYEFQDFGEDKVFPVYRMLSKDADETQSREEEFEKALRDFKEQQYERHIEQMQDVDNQIFHELVVLGIIKKRETDVDGLIDNMIKEEIKSL